MEGIGEEQEKEGVEGNESDELGKKKRRKEGRQNIRVDKRSG